MSWLRQSTAVTLLIGPFLDDTTGKDAETGLTVSQADVRLSKNGGNMAQKNESTACTHDEIGFYTCPLDTTDTNTLGILQICVHESGALPVFITHEIVPANVWDSYFSTDKLQVDCTQIEGGDATDALSAATPTVTLANDAITAAKFDESTAYPVKSADTGATQIARVGADSDTLETLSDEIAAVQGNVTSILEDTGTTLDTLVKDIPTNTELAAAFTEIKGATWAAGTDTLEHIRDKQTDIETDTNELQTDWANAGRLDALLDAVKAKTDKLPSDPADQNAVESAITSAHSTTNGKIDAVDDYVDSEVAAIKAVTDAIGATGSGLSAIPWNASWDAEVQSECTDALNAYDPPTKNELDTGLDALPTAAEIKTAVEAAGSHLALILEDTGTTIPDAITALTEAGIKKNTELAGFTFFMTDSTDHVAETGLTVTAERSLDGAAFAACANAVSEISDGCYTITLAAADLNGDMVTLKFTATGADDLVFTIRTSA